MATSANGARSKRPRTLGEYHSDGDEEDLIASQQSSKRGKHSESTLNGGDATVGYAIGQYRVGSIVRITMKNFVTYTEAECRPGPNLNVVIGPNGSGKSSIVCAMVLGLGGNPSILGRSKEAASFIKHGSQESTIEIELFAGTGKPNHVIRRKLLASEPKALHWYLNGKATRQNVIENLVKEKLGIQVDNLCQFLPQDRVANFSDMDPPLMLKETERAVKGQGFLDLHNSIVEDKKKEQQFRHRFEERTKLLHENQEKNSLLERDVLRFREREKHLEKIRMLKAKRPWLVFEVQREDAVVKKKTFQMAVQALEDYRSKEAPIQDQIRVHEAAIAKADKQTGELREQLKNLDQRRRNISEKLGPAADNIEQLESRKESIASDQARLQKEITQSENCRDTLQQELAEVKEAAAKSADEDSELQKKYDETHHKLAAIQSKKYEIEQRRMKLEGDLKTLNYELTKLTTVRDSRLQRIQEMNQGADAHKAYKWIQANRTRFNGKVFGPIVIEVNVPNETHANYLEQLLPNMVKFAFVVSDPSDMTTLQKELKEAQRLYITVIDAFSSLSKTYHHPNIPRDDLAKVGITHFMDEVFDADPMVKAVMCSFANVHQVGAGDNSSVKYGREDQIPLEVYCTPESFYQKYTSRYDRERGGGRVNRPMRKAKLFTGIDMSKKQTLEQKRRELESDIRELDGDIARWREQEEQKRNEADAIRRSREALTSDKKKVGMVERRLMIEKEKIQGLKKELQSGQSVEKIDAEIKRINDERFKWATQQATIVKDLNTGAVKQSEILMEKIIAMRGKEALEKRLAQVNAEGRQLQAQVERTKLNFDKSKEEARRLKVAAEAEYPLTDELRQKFSELPDGIEELDVEIQNLQVRADAVSPNRAVVDDYERRKQEIEKMTKDMEKEQQQLDVLQKELKDKTDEWLPQVEEIASEINKHFELFFEEIGCEGEIRLARDENDDYEKFGIEILVSYRRGQPKRVLDRQVQSGGERSVATMLYLVSLQQLSKCPFRLVDEINQGMDPNNEKMIFDRVSKQATLPNTPQYFLITPKLLPDLKFDPSITVLCVFNGPWQLPQSQWDFDKLFKS